MEDNDKLKGIRQNLQRRVEYIASVRGVPEFDVWKKIYDIAIRNMTLIKDGKKCECYKHKEKSV